VIIPSGDDRGPGRRDAQAHRTGQITIDSGRRRAASAVLHERSHAWRRWVAIGYPDETTAERARQTVEGLEADLVIQADQVAATPGDARGKYHVTTPMGLVRERRRGVGRLLGPAFSGCCSSSRSQDGRSAQGSGPSSAISARTRSIRRFRTRSATMSSPGTSALFMIIEKATPDKRSTHSSSTAGPSSRRRSQMRPPRSCRRRSLRSSRRRHRVAQRRAGSSTNHNTSPCPAKRASGAKGGEDAAQDDELGPIDVVVIAFPADAPMTGEAVPLFMDLVASGIVARCSTSCSSSERGRDVLGLRRHGPRRRQRRRLSRRSPAHRQAC